MKQLFKSPTAKLIPESFLYLFSLYQTENKLKKNKITLMQTQIYWRNTKEF
jgi:hypothetical protein